ncbi:hypothetical protein SDC9_127880 [bioreactor metagenome]|uniref:Uncharacterized protein n=1 Tax=bioreactor metagenome TaxID=1076179 RepID=A0A645CVB4_9ZZZZ
MSPPLRDELSLIIQQIIKERTGGLAGHFHFTDLDGAMLSISLPFVFPHQPPLDVLGVSGCLVPG